jgi:hypothetical protein
MHAARSPSAQAANASAAMKIRATAERAIVLVAEGLEERRMKNVDEWRYGESTVLLKRQGREAGR